MIFSEGVGKMKKIFLKNMETEALKKLIANNEDFLDIFREQLQNDWGEMQEEESSLMLGTKWTKWIDIKDHYNSFYLILKDWRMFIDNLDKDYLSPEGIAQYEKIITLKNNFDELNEEEQEEQEEIIENECKKLLSICENILHEYEETPKDYDVINYIIDTDQLMFTDYYTFENDSKIYIDKTKIFK